MRLDDLGDVAIIAGGGGLLGINEVGFMKSLINHGIHKRVKRLLGVSVGALVLFPFCRARKAEDWETIWEEISKRFGIIGMRGPEAIFDFSLRRLVTGAESLVDNNRLSDLLKDIDPKECATSPLRFEAAVQSRRHGEKIILANHAPLFKSKPELLAKVPVASSALTPFFAPVKLRLNGTEDSLTDGISIFMGSSVKRCDTIFVLLPYPKRHVPRPPEQYGALSPMRVPLIRNFVESYEIQHKVEDAQVLGCAISHAKIAGHPRIITVNADTCPSTVGPLDFEKKDYALACSAAEELMDKKLHSLGL